MSALSRTSTVRAVRAHLSPDPTGASLRCSTRPSPGALQPNSATSTSFLSRFHTSIPGAALVHPPSNRRSVSSLRARCSQAPDTNMGASSSRPTASRGDRHMMTVQTYKPPPWAETLQPVPKDQYVLGVLPTPIHPWKLPGLPDGCEVWIKRDDLTGCQLSGNKVRKLEFLIADAKAQGCDCVVTIGGIQSNHCRATTVAAKYAGLDAFLILRTDQSKVDQDPGLVGNLLVERLIGANISLVSKGEYVKHGSEALGRELCERLTAEGRKPYLIPVGGSNSLGTWGYLEGVAELEDQLRAGAGPAHVDDIVLACGSGGTAAGTALGVALSSLNAKVHAYGVCDDPRYFYDYIGGILRGMGCDQPPEALLTCLQAKGSGYAVSTPEELATCAEVAQRTGVVLDPVYSGKAVHGLLEEMRRDPAHWQGRKVLFVHTGGLLGMYDKCDQLQPLVEGLSRSERFFAA